MIGSIVNSYSYFNPYGAYRARGAQQPQSVQPSADARTAQEAGRLSGAGGAWSAQRAASPETPVQPVAPVAAAAANPAQSAMLGLPAGPAAGAQGGQADGQTVPWAARQGADPAEMAVRMRIRPYDESSNQFLPARESVQDGRSGEEAGAVGAAGAQKALEEGQCETCEKRKYQDGSDDMGVSFQTPTRVDPDLAAAAVRGHENEHVVREQAKAEREDRRVVSQSVTLHTDICPECGKVYVSGGETRTTTAAKAEPQEQQNAQDKEEERTPFSVWG